MIKISVKVKTGSGRSELHQAGKDDFWTASLKSQPVDGKANKELVGLIPRHFSCPKKCVTIRHGGASRNKLIEIDTG